MVVQLFNSGIVSGPENLVLPAIPYFSERHVVVFLVERRLGEKGRLPIEHARQLGLRAEAVEVRSRVDLLAVHQLRKLLRSLKPKVVHAHDVKASSYLWLASRGEEWKKVSTHHGVEGRPDWKTRAYEYFYSQVVLPRMNVAITVSREDEFTLKRRGLENVLFVANGATRRLWKAGERETERKRIRSLWNVELGGITDDTFLVGMLARLSAEKRHLYFLRTLACLREKHPSLKWRFLAFGSGAMEQSLRAEAKRLGIDNACHWMGYRPDAAGLVPGLDLVAFSSQAEGFPIAAIEAGWAAVPIFASNVGALPELVSTGRTAGGLIFPREQEPRHTAESLAWLLGHPKERERLGTRLQNRVAREYSAQAWVGRMEELYRTI